MKGIAFKKTAGKDYFRQQNLEPVSFLLRTDFFFLHIAIFVLQKNFSLLHIAL